MSVAEKTSGAPLPARLASLLREARWLVVLAAAAYLLLILATFDKDDPSSSHSATLDTVHNAGGRLGAWLADLLLEGFGVSAYWWVVLCVVAVVWGYRRLDGTALLDRRPLAVALCGFAILILSSAALEALRLYSLQMQLPGKPGGIVGEVFSMFAAANLGFTGATLALLTLAAVGLSLFTGVSWIALAELAGFALEAAYGAARGTWERRQDRKAGELAREEREADRRNREKARGTNILRCGSSRRWSRSPSRSGCRRKSRRRCSSTCPTRRCRRSSCSTRPPATSRRCAPRRSNTPRA